MRKLNKWLIGGLFAGFLLIGIGCGVAFAEYCSFEYGGEAILKDSEYFTKTVEYKFNLWPDRVKKAQIKLYNYDWCSMEFLTDTNLQKDEVRFEVQYLSKDTDITPKVISYGDGEETGYFEEIYLATYINDYVGDFEWIMRAKDQILQDLKQGIIREYQKDDVKKIVIYTNPDALFEIVP